MSHPLIKKWLGLEVQRISHIRTSENVVSADELEAKLAEGFEVYSDDTLVFNNLVKGNPKFEKYIALAIGKQPINKKTREEAALEFIQWISEGIYPRDVTEKAKEILEME